MERMPCGLNSVAKDVDSARSGSVAATQSRLPISGSRAESLLICTRLPPPLPGTPGTAARLMRRRGGLSSRVPSHCSSGMERKLVRACSPPALLTRASIRPCRSSTVA